MLLSRKLANSSVEIMDYPARKRKIHRNFDFFLPKFHFILPNFYFGPPWSFPISSGEIGISGDVRVAECGYSTVL